MSVVYNLSPVKTVMIVDDSFDYHAHYHHRLSCSLNIFKFDMVVDDSFYRLNEQMIKNYSFAAAVCQKRGSNRNGKW